MGMWDELESKRTLAVGKNKNRDKGLRNLE